MDLVVRCAHLPEPGETIIADSCEEVPGGKGANQAVAAARAGGRVSMIGRVGQDAFATRLVDNLRTEEVDCSSIRTSPGASGVAVVGVERSGENAIMVVPGANGKVDLADVDAAAESIRGAQRLLVQLEIPLDTVLAAIDVARRASVPVILDPAPMPSSLPDGLLHVDLVCPNQTEASAMIGRAIDSVQDAIDAIPMIRQLGAENVIITLGDQGVVMGDGVSSDWVQPTKVDAVDTTAAGDAFAGALAVRLADGDSLPDAVRFASAAGALAATRPGAQPGMPTASEIEALIHP